MEPQDRWDRINTVGFAVEQLLAWVTFSTLLVFALMLVVRAEWSMLPDDAQRDVICSQEFAASATLGIVGDKLSPAPEVTGQLPHWAEQCAAAIPPQRSLSSRSSPSDGWLAPFGSALSPDGDP